MGRVIHRSFWKKKISAYVNAKESSCSKPWQLEDTKKWTESCKFSKHPQFNAVHRITGIENFQIALIACVSSAKHHMALSSIAKLMEKGYIHRGNKTCTKPIILIFFPTHAFTIHQSIRKMPRRWTAAERCGLASRKSGWLFLRN